VAKLTSYEMAEPEKDGVPRLTAVASVRVVIYYISRTAAALAQCRSSCNWYRELGVLRELGCHQIDPSRVLIVCCHHQ